MRILHSGCQLFIQCLKVGLVVSIGPLMMLLTHADTNPALLDLSEWTFLGWLCEATHILVTSTQTVDDPSTDNSLVLNL